MELQVMETVHIEQLKLDFHLIELDFLYGLPALRNHLISKFSQYLGAYQDGCQMILCTPLFYHIYYRVVDIIGWFSYP